MGKAAAIVFAAFGGIAIGVMIGFIYLLQVLAQQGVTFSYSTYLSSGLVILTVIGIAMILDGMREVNKIPPKQATESMIPVATAVGYEKLDGMREVNKIPPKQATESMIPVATAVGYEKSTRETKLCTRCGSSMPRTAAFCPECATQSMIPVASAV